MGIFKAYDIRGVYPDQLDENLAYKIGRAYASLLQKENPDKKLRIGVGHDMRLSSPQLTKALIEGLVHQGVDVVDMGLVSTPTFYFAVVHHNLDGGLQVSASHNPKEFNGFKMVRKKAIPISGDTGIKEIEAMVEEEDFTEPQEHGSVEKIEGVLQDQVQQELRYVDIKKLKHFKIVADAANAMGALFLEELFKFLPCRLIKMNFDLDGTFPSHQPDPLVEENVSALKKKVLEEKADLGIAPDGDGDRIFFIDNEGKVVEPAILRGMIAQVFLKMNPGATICYDIRPGKITEDLILEAGGKPVLTRVGHSFIKEKMREVDAIFAGESSGHFFLKQDDAYYEVPMVVILKLLEIMSEQDKPLADITRPYCRYAHSGEINSEVADKEAKIQEIKEKYSDGKINELDGLSVEYKDWWFNVRPSNTESLLRLNLEARSKELMEQKRDELVNLIRS